IGAGATGADAIGVATDRSPDGVADGVLATTGTRTTGTRTTGARTTGARTSGAEASGAEASGAEASGAEASGLETSGRHASGAEPTEPHVRAEDGRSDRIEDGNGHRTHRDETNRDERAGGDRSTIAVT